MEVRSIGTTILIMGMTLSTLYQIMGNCKTQTPIIKVNGKWSTILLRMVVIHAYGYDYRIINYVYYDLFIYLKYLCTTFIHQLMNFISDFAIIWEP